MNVLNEFSKEEYVFIYIRFNAPIFTGYEIAASEFGGYLCTRIFAFDNGDYFLTQSDTTDNIVLRMSKYADRSDGLIIYPNPAVPEISVETENTNCIEKVV